jgi:hypothetical protein
VLGAIATCCALTAHAEDWLPVSPEELTMTSEPNAPAAPAIFLYRQVDRDDNGSFEQVYARIKILTEEGRKYADIEIPYRQGSEIVRSVAARTIHPDGSIVNFDGTIFDKPLIKGQGAKLYAKTLTLPGVQVGSIVEYRYRHELPDNYIFNSHWILSQDLFTKHAKFSLIPYRRLNVNFSWPVGLPPGTEAPKVERDNVYLETQNVDAFVSEDHMPPEDALKFRVDFLYSLSPVMDKDPVVYWKRIGKEEFRKVENFIGKRRVMDEAVAKIVAPGDTPEMKLRKIYARTQQIRNTTFERKKTEQEIKRESQTDRGDAAEVWSKGYGDGLGITWLFLGLARSAGFEADAVLVSTRDTNLFNQRAMNASQLNTGIVLVKVDGKEMYCDPGTVFTPFGVLPWGKTGVAGLRLDKNGGTWLDTPLPPPSDSRIERQAKLHLVSEPGSLEGKVTVTYTGLEALWRRVEQRNEDETAHKQFLEQELQSDIPTGINVTLTNKPDWTSSDAPLVAEYDLRVPGWAAAAGQRALLAVGLFGNGEKGTFKFTARVHPLYFNFPNQSLDNITIDLPSGWQASSMPQPQNVNMKVLAFTSAVEQDNSTLHLKRELTVDLLLLDKKYYPQIRDFYQKVRTSDEEQIVVAPSAAKGKR